MGIKEIYVDDLTEEFAGDFVFPMFRANAQYEGEYLLGTSIARPLIAKRQIEIARDLGADAATDHEHLHVLRRRCHLRIQRRRRRCAGAVHRGA